MADPIVNTFSLSWMSRIMRVVQYVEMNLMGISSGRRRRSQAGGDGAGCPPQNCKIQWTVIGNAVSGTFTSRLTINGTPETITFAFDDNAAEVKTALALHSQLASTDLTVTGGPFPFVTVEVEFIATQANTQIALPTSAWGSMPGTGVAVMTSYSQMGHS